MNYSLCVNSRINEWRMQIVILIEVENFVTLPHSLNRHGAPGWITKVAVATVCPSTSKVTW